MRLLHFICLFYLMVLINCHTISKSVYEDYTDNIYENLKDLEYSTKYYKHGHIQHPNRIQDRIQDPLRRGTLEKIRRPFRRMDKLQQPFKKMDKKDQSKLVKIKPRVMTQLQQKMKTQPSTKASHPVKVYLHDLRKKIQSDAVTEMNTLNVYTAEVINNLWDKLQNKIEQKIHKHKVKQVKPKQKVVTARLPQTTKMMLTIPVSHSNHYHWIDKKKKKRDIFWKSKTATSESITKAMSILPYKVFTYTSNKYSTKSKPAKDGTVFYFTDDPPSKSTPNVYLSSNTKRYNLDNHNDDYTEVTTYSPYNYEAEDNNLLEDKTVRDESSYSGTAEIEALLDEIKAKAIQMIAEQNPGLNDLVTNAVTETTYTLDPMLMHVDPIKPIFSTLVSMNLDYDKPVTVNDDTANNNSDNHKIAQRSLKSDIYTMAEDFDSGLQEEIRELVRMLKAKVHNDRYRKASTLTDYNTNLYTKRNVEPTRTSKYFTSSTADIEKKLSKYRERTKARSTTHTIPVIEDEFDMLTLFEQMLTKDHESNKITVLTTSFPIKRQVRNIKVNKRNSETLADLSLKAAIQIEKEGEGMPDDKEENTSEESTRGAKEEKSTTYEVPGDDGSFEGLSNKLSYSQYVKGYKHYLEFTQNDLNDKNFSELIRYQAHKHHKVDDIGKFILEKIPEVPKYEIKNKRFFLDGLDSVYKGTTTRDPSWFQKHFYLLMDTGTNKKFHTSQTVELKSADHNATVTTIPEKKDKQRYTEMLDEKKVELDDIMKDLYEQTALNKVEEYAQTKSLWNQVKDPGEEIIADNRLKIRDLDNRNIVQKLMSLVKRNYTKGLKATSSNPYNINKMYYLTERFKRNLKKNKKDRKEEGKTKANVSKAYVDVNIIPRPTAPVVKLKEDGKDNRFVNLFKKISFHKQKKKKIKDKKKPHSKRDLKRYPRFNPIKTLKNMFKNNEVYKNLFDESDLGLLTTKINAFKVVNYDKVPTPEEMSRMIPNITGNEYEDITMTESTNKYNDIKYGSVPKNNKYGELPKYAKYNKYDDVPDYKNANDVTGDGGFTKLIPKITIQNGKTTNNILKVKVSKVKDPDDYIKIKEVDDAFDKMKYPNEVYEKAKYPNTDSFKMFKADKHKIFKQQPTAKSNIKSTPTESTASIHSPLYLKSFSISSPNFDNVIVKTTPSKDRTPKPKVHIEYINRHNDIQKRHSFEDVSVTESTFNEYSSSHYENAKGKNKNYTTYPDYFNDLMLWHNDILNMDGVSRDSANDLFKLKHLDVFEAPDIGNMQKEVMKMEEYISSLDDNKNAHNKKKTFDLKNEERAQLRAMGTDSKGNIHKKSTRSTNIGFHKFSKGQDSSSTSRKYDPARTSSPGQGDEDEIDQDDATIETTILAYDHEGGGKVWNANAALNKKKKATKAAQTAHKSRVRFNRTIGKKTTAAHPQQRFTTPVPMTKEDFDNFLKQNNMDVQSVTTPLTDMWKFEDKWFYQKSESKSKENKQSLKVKQGKQENEEPAKTVASNNKKVANVDDHNYIDYDLFSNAKFSPEFDAQYINQFDSFKDDDYKYENSKNRHKNRSVRNLGSSRNEKKLKPNRIKRKTKKSVLYGDNVDITIINLEDTISTATLQDKADLSDVGTKFQIEKPTRFGFGRKPNVNKVPNEMISNVQTMHNDLLFDRTKAVIEPANTMKSFQHDESPHKFSTSFNTDSPESYNEFKVPFENVDKPTLNFEDVWQKLKMKANLPKSIQMSSQSIRFDVIYHDSKTTDAINLAKNKPDNLTHTELLLNGTESPRDMDGNDSEITNIVKVAKVVEAVENATKSPVIRVDLPAYTPETVTNKPGNNTKFEAKLKTNDENYSNLINMALMKVLNKYELNQTMNTDNFDVDEFGGVDFGYNDGVAKRSNASGVFRDSAGIIAGDYKGTTPMSGRYQRAAIVDKPMSAVPLGSYHSNKAIISTTISSTKKRHRLNFLPYFQEKLLKLVGKKEKEEKTSVEKAVTKAIAKMKPSKRPLIETTKSTKKIVNTETVKISPKKKDKTSTTNVANTNTNTTDKVANKVEKLFDYDFSDLRQLSTMKMDEKTLISDYLQSLELKRQFHEPIATAMEPVIIGGKLDKRDIQCQDAFTVKNVAALEVVVDMMRNGVHSERTSTSYVQNSPASYPYRYTQDMATRSPTNSVQVHIAVPYVSLKDKRSQDPLAVRRVFSAKMYTPVDIEYRIHSYENNNEFTSVTKSVSNCDISPGIYLLVENPHKGSFSLKPIKKTINVRQIDSSKVNELLSTESGEKSDSTVSPKIGRVTLSKDFISAINKQLLEFNTKGTTVNFNEVTKHIVNIRDVEKKSEELETESINNSKKKKKALDWDLIKRFFGNDRACSCHLKVNRTMCAACAASDAVMSELIFEFENMAKYMDEHCTEIQTFFWMNPTGGRKLRDTVHKIDRSLHDYFKRVKGKCQGRTCQTYSTYIDRKRMVKPNEANITSVEDFGNYLEDLAEDLAKVNEYKMVGDNNLKNKSKQVLQALNDCMSEKSVEKRSVKYKNGQIDNPYSLDKINVNIICKPDTTEFDLNLYGTVPSTVSTILNYDDDESTTKKTRKLFQNLFTKLKKINHKYKKKTVKIKRNANRKRDVKNQLESPLISDTGGSFWHDYLTKASTRNIDVSDLSPQIYMNLIQAEKNANNNRSVKENVKDTLLKVKDNVFVGITNAYKYYMSKEKTENSQPFGKHTDVLNTEKCLTHIVTTEIPTAKNITTVADVDKTTLQDIERILQEINKATVAHHEKQHQSTKSSSTKLHDKHLRRKTKKPKKSTKSKKDKIKFEGTTKKQKGKFMITFTGIDGAVDDTHMTKPLLDDIITSTSPGDDLFPSSSRNLSASKVDQTTKNESLLSKFKKTFGFGSCLRGEVDLSSTTELDVYEKEDMRFSRSINNNSEVFPQITDEPVRNVMSEHTSSTSTNPTILIIEDYDDSSELVFTINNIDSESIKDNIDKSVTTAYDQANNDDKFNNADLKKLLASILKYEKDKLNNDWKRYVDPRLVTVEDEMPDLDAGFFAAHTTAHPTKQSPNKEFASGDYCIIKALRNLHLPDPFAVSTYSSTPRSGTTRKTIHVMIGPDSEVLKQAGAEGWIVEVYSRSINQRSALSSRKKIGNKYKIRVLPLPSATSILSNSTTLVPSLEANFTTNNTVSTEASMSTEAVSNNTDTTSTTMLSTREAKEESAVTNDNERVTKKMTSGEACDPATMYCICDIHATYNHVKELHETLNKKDFERYARNVSCFQFKHAPKYFLVDISTRSNRYTDVTKASYMISPKPGVKWDWIRNKRSVKTHKGKKSYDYVYDDYYNQNDVDYVRTNEGGDLNAIDQIFDLKDNDRPFRKMRDLNYDRDTKIKTYKQGKFDENIANKFKETDQINYFDEDLESKLIGDGYESYFKDSNEVYRLRKRKKRTAVDMRELKLGLRNLPPLRPVLNEIYAMQEDDITIECTPRERYVRMDKSKQDFVWESDRPDMLKYDNVVVNDNVITVRKVGVKNAGNYTCRKGSLIQRIVQLTVLVLPEFHLVFIPTYATNQGCTYDDLKAVQQLGPVMSRESCSCKDHKSIEIDEPLCLRDRLSVSTQIKATGILSPCPRIDVSCSPQCRRDLQCSLALLVAANALPLTNVPVIISKNGAIKTLKPTQKIHQSAIVTHTLRKKDLGGNQGFHRLASTMYPGNVDIVVTCPAGYCLLVKEKICAVCPSDTYSSEGENVCVPCPAGSSSGPGSARCRLGLARLRRYDWWCKVSTCMVVGVVSGVGVAAVACVALRRSSRSEGQQVQRRKVAVGDIKRTTSGPPPTPCARPITPSRVLLSRFFKTSMETMASSRATDSQETKFEQWKERNIPPPLPPIDFDM